MQAAHATLEIGFRQTLPNVVCHLVLLAVPNEETLTRWAFDLKCDGINHHCFFEPDDGMGYSALATEPLPDSARKRFKKLPLWHAP